jgi:hypothetical protein
LVIINTPKKHPKEAERMLDPIDSSMRSHQDEGNSGIIDPIDLASDYLPVQLKFFFNPLRNFSSINSNKDKDNEVYQIHIIPWQLWIR